MACMKKTTKQTIKESINSMGLNYKRFFFNKMEQGPRPYDISIAHYVYRQASNGLYILIMQVSHSKKNKQKFLNGQYVVDVSTDGIFFLMKRSTNAFYYFKAHKYKRARMILYF